MKVRIEKAIIEELVDVLGVVTDAKQEGEDLILDVTDPAKIREVFKDRDIDLTEEFIIFKAPGATVAEVVETKPTIDDIWKSRGFVKRDDLPNASSLIDIETKIEGVESVYLTRAGLCYKINNCQSGEYYFGNFTVYDNGGESVKIFNEYILEKEEYDEGCIDHPHVRDGLACFGNIESNIKYTKEMGVRIMLIKEFLNSYNPDDDWGQEYVEFPTINTVKEFING